MNVAPVGHQPANMTAVNGDIGEIDDLTVTELEQIMSGHVMMEGVNHLMNPSSDVTGSYFGDIQQASTGVSHMMMNGNNLHHNMPQAQPHMMQQQQQVSTLMAADPLPNTRSQTEVNEPWVEILEQPKQRGLRFRYQCEGRSAGSIPGENSTNENKTFPTVKIHNYRGSAIIVVSCVTKDAAPNCKPHPHSLVGKDCKKGVCTVKVKEASVVSFPQLGIQCAKKKDVEDALKLRKEINVDPYQTGFEHTSSNIDLNVVRLCFQVFLPDTNGKVTRVVPPVVSYPIHDKKALNDLIICRVDRSSGRARGGDEMFLLCEKVSKEDIKVRFFEEENGEVVWEAFGDFGQGDVHRQFAIVFKTPKYKEEFISHPVIVNMQLFRPSDNEGSESIKFTFMPEDPDPDRIEEKRKRKGDWLNKMMSSSGSSDGPSSSSSSVKESLRHMLKASRRIKQEPQANNAQEATSVQGISMSSQGSGSSLEPLSSTSQASRSLRMSDNPGVGHVTVSSSSQSRFPAASSADTNTLMQPFVQQQLLQQQLATSGNQASATGAQMSITSTASGNSQTVSLDEGLLNLVTMPTSTLMSTFDANAFQSLLEQGISFSSGDGSSTNMAEMQVAQNGNTVGGNHIQIIMDPTQQQQHADFLEVQAALESLNQA